MTRTEQEIFHQPQSLRQTYESICGQAEEIGRWLGSQTVRRWVFTGCGSSYSLARSAEAAFRLRGAGDVCSVPAGDLLMNFPSYAALLDGAVLVSLSRSGSTSEAVQAAKLAQAHGASLLSVVARTGSELAGLSGLTLEIPWAFDHSVCQTQTVANLYLASLLLCAVATGDDGLCKELGSAVAAQGDFLARWREPMERLAAADWTRVVVLADGDLCGLAEEGALAFNEICQVPSNYYHILDVRHGPMVLIGRRTLVAVAARAAGPLLDGLLRDLKAKGATVLLACGEPANAPVDVFAPLCGSSAAPGLPFLALLQMVSLFRAEQTGVDPDQPDGLDPWIRLEV